MYVNSNGNGGALSASNVTFQNSSVYLYRNASLSLSGNQFVSGDVHVVPELANSLVGNNFPAGSAVNVMGGTLSVSASLPSISNVSKYNLSGSLWIDNGGSLSIAAGNTIIGSTLYVNSSEGGATLSASNVAFQNSSVYLYRNASLSLSGNQFVSGDVHVVPELANSLVGNNFPAGSAVNVMGGTLSVSASLPSIPNVSKYNLSGSLWIDNGGSLSIAAGNTIIGSTLYVNSNERGGTLAAQGVTFSNQLRLEAGSTGILKYNKFTYAGYNHFDGHMLATVTHNDFAASQARAQGTGGPINLESNYWGTTDCAVIGQTKIYDHTDSASLPFIDYGAPLATSPVPPADAWQRQVYRLSAATFDGIGNDINLWLGDVVAGQQVQVYVGQTFEDLRPVGSFTNSGTSPWLLSLDIHAANLARAEYVALTSTQSVIILAAMGLYQNLADLSGYIHHDALAGNEPQFQRVDYANVAKLYRWDWDTHDFVPLPEADWRTPSVIDWSEKTIVLTHGWNSCLIDSVCRADFI